MWQSRAGSALGIPKGLQGASLGLVYGDKLIQAGAEPALGGLLSPLTYSSEDLPHLR